MERPESGRQNRTDAPFVILLQLPSGNRTWRESFLCMDDCSIYLNAQISWDFPLPLDENGRSLQVGDDNSAMKDIISMEE